MPKMLMIFKEKTRRNIICSQFYSSVSLEIGLEQALRQEKFIFVLYATMVTILLRHHLHGEIFDFVKFMQKLCMILMITEGVCKCLLTYCAYSSYVNIWYVAYLVSFLKNLHMISIMWKWGNRSHMKLLWIVSCVISKIF